MSRPLIRALRFSLWTFAGLLLLWLALIEAPMWLTRWRMSRLLADFHAIYPNQSNWQDAQRLMTRWGKWGHYDGVCDAKDCTYTIRLVDPASSGLGLFQPDGRPERVTPHVMLGMLYAGWRETVLILRVSVQDGKIVRTSTHFLLEVPPFVSHSTGDQFLVLRSQVRSHLIHRDAVDGELDDYPGDAEQIEDHPDYRGGQEICSGCMLHEVAYTPFLKHVEIIRLTSYQMPCVTRFLGACSDLRDALPAARQWHIVSGREDEPSPPLPIALGPCHIDPRALGRDADTVLQVEALSALSSFKMETAPGSVNRELARVRILHQWKAVVPEVTNSIVSVIPYEGTVPPQSPSEPPEHLIPGQHVFLILSARIPWVGGDDKTKIIAYFLPRCGVVEDTPANLAALQAGIAQDIPYRHPPKFGE